AFTDTLAGRIVQQSGVTRAIVSMAGPGTGDQNVLVRADLLLAPSRLENTSFRMEFLPSGAICSGCVSAVRHFGFEARCRMPDGSSRRVHARWRLGGAARLHGLLDVRPS